MRYFLHLAYKGTNFNGWQRQPNALGVQQSIEDTFSMVLRTPVEITGCGRTDTGVHASSYYAHFDFEGGFPEGFLRRVNKILPADIVIFSILPVTEIAHARFDAIKRSYVYRLGFVKNPFNQDTVTFFPFADKLDIQKVNDAATLLLNYSEFFPFCKSDHDAKTLKCELTEFRWEFFVDGSGANFHISANRFLRGMVRLIVGMCLNVGLGKIELETVKEAMDHQILLKRAESAPSEGLYLSYIEYPYL
ncbi:MAG: tRNA pseudouridine synthase A [Saprospiraceae bacterium]